MGTLAFLALLASSLPPPAEAYLREDHYYAARTALAAGARPIEGAELVAICAQLPDEAPELSAVDNYRRLMKHPIDYASWSMRNAGPPETVGRMLTVQQLQHGLTGGSPEALRTVAEEIAQALAGGAMRPGPGRADALCALGMALHLYGDSFSHQRIKNPGRLYGTGIGHLFDSSRPDLPLLSASRLELWRRHVLSASTLLPHGEPSRVQDLLSDASRLLPAAAAANGYHRLELRRAVLDRLRSAGLDPPRVAFDPALRDTGCQNILDRQAEANVPALRPSCERAWALFRDAAVREFSAYEAAPPPFGPLRAREYTRIPYFLGPIFSRGPRW